MPQQPINPFTKMLHQVRGIDINALEACELRTGLILHDADKVVQDMYLPESGVVSLVVPMQDDKVVEVAIVGNEGAVGLPAVLNDRRSHIQAVVQVPGSGHRLPIEMFVQAMDSDEHFRRMAQRYVAAHMQYITQSVACNRLHRLQQRMCRWLLSCHDRVVGDVFPLTQRFLAQMLAVQRPTVSEAAARLQYEGLITYKRGVITILERSGLERCACECYAVVRREYDRLIGRDI